MKRTSGIVACCLFLLGGLNLAAAENEAETKAISKIRELGGLVLEIAQNDKRLDVTYQSGLDKVTDDDIKPLHDLTRLAHLNLRATDITDAGLAAIANQATLVRLHLEKTKITDSGLAHLKGLVNLEYLNLYGTQVSDAGLVNLAGMKKLKSLYLWQTKVTDAGVAKLKKELPQVQVVLGTAEFVKPVPATEKGTPDKAKSAEPAKKPESAKKAEPAKQSAAPPAKK